MENSANKPQQWELFASQGHVLLARVDAYRLKSKGPKRISAWSTMLIPVAFLLAGTIASGIGSSVGWITGTVLHWHAPKAIVQTPAPAAREFEAVLPSAQFDPSTIPSLATDVAPAMLAQVAAMTAGKKMEDCDFTKKITDAWYDGKDATPKCRYSKDGTRLWVWAFVKKDEYRYGPFAGLIVRLDGKVTYANVEARNIAQINGYKSINPKHIPRTVVADFPELLIEGGK